MDIIYRSFTKIIKGVVYMVRYKIIRVRYLNCVSNVIFCEFPHFLVDCEIVNIVLPETDNDSSESIDLREPKVAKHN